MITSKNFWSLLLIAVWAILLGVPVSLAHSQTAHAASRLDGYTLTVSASNTSFDFATTGQWVTGTLTLLNGPTHDQFDGHCFFQIDGQQFVAPSVRIDGPPWIVTFQVSLPLTFAIGVHTIRAGFTSTVYGTTIYSDPITVTVHKITTTLGSVLGDFMDHPFWPAGESYTMVASLDITSDQRSVSDWKTGTYTLAFTGPQNVTSTNLVLDSSEDITIRFPTIKGDYQFKLTFNGTDEVNPVSESGSTKITAGKAVTITLYSTPTTITESANVNVSYYVVVSGVAGYPPPTGQIIFYLGNYESDLITLRSDGTVEVSINWYAVTNTYLDIYYYGNYNYVHSGYVQFSLTNPAIPTTGGTNPTSSPTAHATPSYTPSPAHATPSHTPPVTLTKTATAAKTSTPKATATHTPAPMSTPTAIATSNIKTTNAPTSGSSPLPGGVGGWVLGTCIPITCCAGAVGFGAWRRRKKRQDQAASALPDANSEIIEVHASDLEDPVVKEEATFPVDL